MNSGSLERRRIVIGAVPEPSFITSELLNFFVDTRSAKRVERDGKVWYSNGETEVLRKGDPALDENNRIPGDSKVLTEKDVVYDLVDVVEEPRIDAIVGGRLQDEIMKKVAEIAERVAREQFPAIAERIVREEIEKLKKSFDETH